MNAPLSVQMTQRTDPLLHHPQAPADTQTEVHPLWHVSENPNITFFNPRLPPSPHPLLQSPVVWAVDPQRLAHYLLPRDCPRVCFYALPDSSKPDRHLLGSSQHVVAIESAWLERAWQTALTLYRFDPSDFECCDQEAGYWVSSQPQQPVETQTYPSALQALAATGVEIRVLPNLWPLQRQVVLSGLAFSCIRMRNAQPESNRQHVATPDRE